VAGRFDVRQRLYEEMRDTPLKNQCAYEVGFHAILSSSSSLRSMQEFCRSLVETANPLPSIRSHPAHLACPQQSRAPAQELSGPGNSGTDNPMNEHRICQWQCCVWFPRLCLSALRLVATGLKTPTTTNRCAVE